MPSWTQVALSDMRQSSSDSYALNDDVWWGRSATTSLTTRATLVMGKYPTSEAWDSNINPDAGELSWTDSSYSTMTWNGLTHWSHTCLGTTYQLAHLPGFINNTRVMFWDQELWVKSKATGLWTQRLLTNATGGGWWDGNFAVFYGDGPTVPSCFRIEPTTGYCSLKFPMAATQPGQPAYWLWHSWPGAVTIDPWDVADVISCIKTSLVVDDPYFADDRQYSRFQWAVGADYTPAEPLGVYPGVGAARMKYVTAQWPNWQYHVMHTMTQSQFAAANGYPSAFGDASEGGGGGGGTDPVIPWSPALPAWADLEVTGVSAWGDAGVAQTPYVSGGMPPVLRRRR